MGTFIPTVDYSKIDNKEKLFRLWKCAKADKKRLRKVRWFVPYKFFQISVFLWQLRRRVNYKKKGNQENKWYTFKNMMSCCNVEVSLVLACLILGISLAHKTSAFRKARQNFE